MSGIKNIILRTGFALLIMLLATEGLRAQTGTPVYYVCADVSFKLLGQTGYDEYEWKEGNNIITGADSSTLPVAAAGAAAVGNTADMREYHLRVKNSGSCWSEEATFVVYVLPKLEPVVSGYTPPYCENLPHAITLTANINGGTGASQLSLPPGVGIAYDWIVSQGFSSPPPVGNAGIVGPTNNETADVLTPQTTLIDNTYILKVSYTYPATVDPLTDVVGNCGGSYTQVVHADPEPAIPVIQVQQF